MTARLFTASERGLATLRIKAFRHVHDLPLLTQNTEHRGALVSRVTSDVDQVSQFLVFGGVFGIISIGQVLLATVVMLFYSWQLTILVWVCFLPLFLSLRYFQRRLSAAYGVVRRSVGAMLSAISEPVVGAVTVRTYAIEKRTQDRIDEAISVNQVAATRAQGLTAFSFSLGGVSGRAGQRGRAHPRHLARVRRRHHLRRGDRLRVPGDAVRRPGADGHPGAHRRPERDRRLASGDRDPGDPGRPRRPRPLRASRCRAVRWTSPFDDVSFGYPGGPLVLRDVTEHIESGSRVAVVGETGSGKTTFAKLLTRLMDPTLGSGAARRRRHPLGRVRLAAPPGRAGAAGGLPVRLDACSPTRATATSTRPPTRSARPRPSSVSATGSTGCRAASRPGSASAASRCRRASASWSRCSGPTWPTPTCSCSTRPPARSTPPWRCASAAPSSG